MEGGKTWRHAFTGLNPRMREGLTVHSRRSILKTGLAGMAGLSLPSLLQAQSAAVKSGVAMPSNKSVILLWMTGGPSHIDTWDPKPDAPRGIRGPFETIGTKIPGVRICEHLPRQAAMLDKMTLIRSVVCKGSSHQPNHVMQTGDITAAPRKNPKGKLCPAIGSMIAKHYGANADEMPPYVALNLIDKTHAAWGGYLGKKYDPFLGNEAAKSLKLPNGLTMDRVQNRHSLHAQMDRLRAGLDLDGSMDGVDQFTQQAYNIVAGGKTQGCF